MLAVGKGGFNSLHGNAWLRPLLYPRYWFVVDLVVKCKITLNIFLVSLNWSLPKLLGNL